MPSKKKQAEESERLNLTLAPEIAQNLNDYCVKWANHRSKMPSAMKTSCCYGSWNRRKQIRSIRSRL